MVMAQAKVISNRANRVAVSTVFFLHGLCFASWASRIPNIQESLKLSASALGAILFALPIGFFLSLPFASWLVGRLGSKKVVVPSVVLYALSLTAIGLSPNIATLTTALFFFGFFGNLVNIAINTQAVNVESSYGRKLMASFHGLWSLAGFAGAAIGTLMIGESIEPRFHFAAITITVLITMVICSFYLVAFDKGGGSGEKTPMFALPDKTLIGLGLIAFCSMMAEGAMFDWSGIYFIKVVNVDPKLTGAGYTSFMIAMAGTRFIADSLSARFGLKRILQLSGALTTAGLLLSVMFPQLFPALIGFFLIGMGVSSVVPMVYSAAGRSKTMAPGTALTAVSSLGFLGLLLAPPLIGFIADASSLRISFLMISVMSIAVVVLATRMSSSSDPDISGR
jgi:MFS family permease